MLGEHNTQCWCVQPTFADETSSVTVKLPLKSDAMLRGGEKREKVRCVATSHLNTLRGSRGEFWMLPICFEADKSMMAMLGRQMTEARKKYMMKRCSICRYMRVPMPRSVMLEMGVPRAYLRCVSNSEQRIGGE